MKNLFKKPLEKLNSKNFEVVDNSQLAYLFGGMVSAKTKDKDETFSASRDGVDYHKSKRKD
ncbi:MAG: hypothetical protein U0X71_02040 [Sphingobacteriaceae bacterium]|nr:MAG: hypothetical protein E6Q66_01030 [Pedobacter sp.]